MQKSIGNMSFLAGVVLSVVASLMAGFSELALGFAALLGVIVGILNIDIRESQKALLLAIALGILGGSFATLGKVAFVGSFIGPIVQNLGVFLAVTAVVSVIKIAWDIYGK